MERTVIKRAYSRLYGHVRDRFFLFYKKYLIFLFHLYKEYIIILIMKYKIYLSDLCKEDLKTLKDGSF
ncbi:MAG: hypothetical protein BGO67_03805 [Alphaproteobacteria bacterium 41-28]|nr:MAG: hypothetical protein BGO67_03805 [Alphaproteobacteria bacterium 41-28]